MALVFKLSGIDFKKLDEKYNLSLKPNLDVEEPEDNITKISDLNNNVKIPRNITFLDDMKNMIKCGIVMIDFKQKRSIHGSKYHCYWCRHSIEFHPIGIPVDYVPHCLTKNYFSEITRDNYTITQYINDEEKSNECIKHDDRISLEKNGYYLTDGVFCSFNCIKSYLEDNKKNELYQNSTMYLNTIYKKLTNNNYYEIIPAPDWKTLDVYGGFKTIEEFREELNSIEYKDKGILKQMQSVSYLFEKNFKI